MIKTRDVVKTGLQYSAMFGIGHIVGNAIQAVAPPKYKLLSKALTYTGAMILTDILAKKAYDGCGELVDSTYEAIDKVKEAFD